MEHPVQRPPEFDARVLAYMPMLRSQATKRAPAGKREDLIQDTLFYALSKWENFREDGSFYNWLVYCMRAVISNNRAKKTEQEDPDGRLASGRTQPPSQEDAAELDRVLRRISDTKDGDSLLAFAAGIDQGTMADRDGVTRQAISQRLQRARRGLSKVARVKRAYNRTKPRSCAKKVAA